MSAARRKGNALERAVAARLHAVDGADPRLGVLETAGGRLGPVYELQIDAATRRYVVECKNREDNPGRVWEWLDKLYDSADRLRVRIGDDRPKVPLLVIKRNHRRPLVVMRLDEFERIAGYARTSAVLPDSRGQA